MARSKHTKDKKKKKLKDGEKKHKEKKKVRTVDIKGTETKKERKKHKWRPGTKAKRLMKREQEGTKVVATRAGVTRAIVEEMHNNRNGMRIKAKAITVAQQLAEDILLDMLRRGTALKRLSGKDTLTASLVEALVSLQSGDLYRSFTQRCPAEWRAPDNILRHRLVCAVGLDENRAKS